MNNEEKILEMLTQMQGDLTGVKDDLAGVKVDLAGVKVDLAGVKDDIHRINVRLDLDVDRRLDALAEGQSAIEERLDALAEVKTLAEETRDKVDVIHAVVTQHSGAITELKKARG